MDKRQEEQSGPPKTPAEEGSRLKVCLITNHPKHRGGGGTYFRAIFDILRSRPELEITILSMPEAGEHSLHIEPLSYLISRVPGLRIEETEGVQVIVSGSVRRLEALAFRGARSNWLPYIQAADIVIGIAGTCMQSYPLTGTGKRYIVFVATSMRDEKKYTQNYMTRNLLYLLNSPFLRRMEKSTFEEAALIFAPVPPICEMIARENQISPDKVRLFPIPVDTEKFRPGNLPPERGNIIWVARHYDRRKNTGLLLRAVAHLARTHPEVKLTLLGSALSPELFREARELGLESRLEVPGWVSEKEKLEHLRRADLFVVPSNQEGLCIAALEAMACSLPVISTRCIGPEAFVRDGVNGFLTPRGDSFAIAEKIALLLDDRDLRARMGRAARSTVVEEYSQAVAADVIWRSLAEVWPEMFSAPVETR